MSSYPTLFETIIKTTKTKGEFAVQLSTVGKAQRFISDWNFSSAETKRGVTATIDKTFVIFKC